MSKRTISQALIDEHRYINVEHDWWEHVVERIKEDQAKRGVTVNKVYFTGFWSQGDGACFEGRIYSGDMATFMEAHGLHEKFPHTYRLAQHGGLGLRLRHRGSYYHEHSVDFDWWEESIENVWQGDFNDVVEACFPVWDRCVEEEREDFTTAAEGALRDAMRDAYRRLEEEYEYLTSDEAVRETLEANEIFDEEADEEAGDELCAV